MKIVLTAFSLGMLFAGLPLLHGWLVLLAFGDAFSEPHRLSLFYLFTVPAWVLATAVYVVETYRWRVVGRGFKMGNVPLLGLLGLVMPAAGLVLSPLAGDLGFTAWAGVASTGLVAGLAGALLFGIVTRHFDKSEDR